MTGLMLIEDRPGFFDEFRPGADSFVPVQGNRGVALVRLAGSGILTVDLALPGYAGYRCVTALGGGASEVPILAVVGCDQSIPDRALGARLRAFVRRNRALRLAHMAGWPSTLGLPSREFDRLMAVVRRCGRVATQPERQYVLTVRTVGFLTPSGTTLTDHGSYADAWHAMQFAIARDTTSEHRAIA